MANSITERYPDDHPLVRDHRLSIVQGGQTTEYVTRDLWEETVAQRDEFRRVLSFISAWRLSSHTHTTQNWTGCWHSWARITRALGPWPG